MAERDGIFAGDDPFVLARAWLAEAQAHEPNDPDAAALATVDGTGLPNVRVVLMRGIEDDGFVFYTNYDSAKGRELDGAGKAAFVIHWKSMRRQIRVRGAVERVEAAQSDAYFRSRALQSRIGAWASEQSRPLKDRATLMARVAKLSLRLGLDPDRPPHWGGYRITPVEIEFWADGAFRLHDRFRWTRDVSGAPWSVSRLNP
jgi:pyridoxamine 5'-phosphate oxidase